jgi:UDP-glucose 4-epimerase
MRQAGMRVYNIGTGVSYSVRELCAAAEEATGRQIPVLIAARREGDPPALCASPRRIMEELGWKPKHSSLREILESAWFWKQKRWEQRQLKNLGAATSR